MPDMVKCVGMGCPYAATNEVPFMNGKGEVVLLQLCAFHRDIEPFQEIRT